MPHLQQQQQQHQQQQQPGSARPRQPLQQRPSQTRVDSPAQPPVEAASEKQQQQQVQVLQRAAAGGASQQAADGGLPTQPAGASAGGTLSANLTVLVKGVVYLFMRFAFRLCAFHIVPGCSTQYPDISATYMPAALALTQQKAHMPKQPSEACVEYALVSMTNSSTVHPSGA